MLATIINTTGWGPSWVCICIGHRRFGAIGPTGFEKVDPCCSCRDGHTSLEIWRNRLHLGRITDGFVRSLYVPKVDCSNGFHSKGAKMDSLLPFRAATNRWSNSMHLTCLSINIVPTITFVARVSAAPNRKAVMCPLRSTQSRITLSILNVKSSAKLWARVKPLDTMAWTSRWRSLFCEVQICSCVAFWR